MKIKLTTIGKGFERENILKKNQKICMHMLENRWQGNRPAHHHARRMSRKVLYFEKIRVPQRHYTPW